MAYKSTQQTAIEINNDLICSNIFSRRGYDFIVRSEISFLKIKIMIRSYKKIVKD